MSDSDNFENKEESAKVDKLALAKIKIESFKKVNKLSQGEWLITQEILQDIQAKLLVEDPNKKTPYSKLSELLKQEIELRYSDDEEVKNILIDSIPSDVRIGKWLKIKGWDDAVWAKLKNNSVGLFSKENRMAVIESLRRRAVDGSDSAAKIWLTLSGDYSDKMDINTDKRVETYREINEILHRKSSNSDNE